MTIKLADYFTPDSQSTFGQTVDRSILKLGRIAQKQSPYWSIPTHSHHKWTNHIFLIWPSNCNYIWTSAWGFGGGIVVLNVLGQNWGGTLQTHNNGSKRKETPFYHYYYFFSFFWSNTSFPLLEKLFLITQFAIICLDSFSRRKGGEPFFILLENGHSPTNPTSILTKSFHHFWKRPFRRPFSYQKRCAKNAL